MSDGEEMGKAFFEWRALNHDDITKLLNDSEDGFKSLKELTYSALVLGLQDLNNAYETHKWMKEHEGEMDGDD